MPTNPPPPPTGQTPPPSGSNPQPLPPPAPGPANLSQLQKAVAAITTVEDSAVKLINGMAAEITQLTDEAGPNGSVPSSELHALAQQLEQSTKALAQAVKANTPAGYTPAPPTPAGSTPASTPPSSSSSSSTSSSGSTTPPPGSTTPKS
jgi:hypothetical protein